MNKITIHSRDLIDQDKEGPLNHLGFQILYWYHLISYPNRSRFVDFFNPMNIQVNEYQIQHTNTNPKENPKAKNKRKKKRTNMEINLQRILNAEDKRTSIMIKNIPEYLSKEKVISWILSLVNTNYIHVPWDEDNKQILGYAFINLLNYRDIIYLLEKFSNVNYFPKFYLGNKLICPKQPSICYTKKQGVKKLNDTFGPSDWSFNKLFI